MTMACKEVVIFSLSGGPHYYFCHNNGASVVQQTVTLTVCYILGLV